MSRSASRRRFLQVASASGAYSALGDVRFLSQLSPLRAEEVKPQSTMVQLQPEIEPLVRLIEDTPRERLLEEVAGRIRRGVSYRELLAALQLAGVRNVQPRPEVGFKFHSVLVVNSAHLASVASPDEHRWLPIFWALDYFKDAQADDVRQGNWTMAPVNEAALPAAHKARAAWIEAMDRWDESAADAAIAALVRSASSTEIFELMFRYGARDFRSIGHKAIFVANSMRTLQVIGWQHAEPVLRSLSYALLLHEGSNPADRDGDADRPWRKNSERANKIREDWQAGAPDDKATLELLTTLRGGSADESSDKVVELLNRGAAPASLWDALLTGAAELLVRQGGIVSLHAVTTANALHYAWQTSGNDNTRRMLLLQCSAFVPLFLAAMGGRGKVQPFELDKLEPASITGEPTAAVEEIFAGLKGDRLATAAKTLALLKNRGNAQSFMDAARVLIFLKGTNTHDYKFSSAALEDYFAISPAWRDRYLAASVFNLRGSTEPDNELVKRTRTALTA